MTESLTDNRNLTEFTADRRVQTPLVKDSRRIVDKRNLTVSVSDKEDL